MQHETADFIKIKEEELKAISEHFENLNKMDIDRIEETIQTNSQKNTIDNKGKGDRKDNPSALSNASSKNLSNKK